jgi:pSer/pThr/pTyr-binding forkhead associated (FHA) protein
MVPVMPDRFLTHRSRSRASLAMRRPDPGRYLAVEDGPETVLLALRPGMTRIGRSATADIAFDDGGVSRRHAVVITRTDGAAEVLDDGSLNGTFVNGERVRRRVLHHGDLLTVGRRTLRFLEVRTCRSSGAPDGGHTVELAPPGRAVVAAA